MGVIRFLVARRDRMADDAVERAYMAGLDEIPWQTRTAWNASGLEVQRAESDSGNFFIPCLVEGHGELVLSTASLMERERPYQLEVELARGTLNRLRNQLAVWEALGMIVGAPTARALAAAHEHFSWAVTRQDDAAAAADRALVAVHLALDAIGLLNDAYVEQALAARHQHSGKLSTLLGVNLGSFRPDEPIGRQIVAAFNTALVPLTWRDIEASEGKRDWSLADQQIEWCRAQGLKICSGPLLEIDKWSLPDWMYLWGEGDEENFRTCVAEHIQAVVERYRGRVQLWQCAARLNTPNDFAHDEEERLRLAVLAIQSIRRFDPRAPIVITIDQPWGTYMARDECDLSPLHFADALVRADLGLSGIGLEINFGYTPGGSEPRDAVEFGRQFDRWSALGLPLLVTLCSPSAGGADPQARQVARPLGYWGSGALSLETQRVWGQRFLGALLAKQPVQGIMWSQLSDRQPHAYPHGGLLDEQDRPKPIFELVGALRRQHLV